MTNGIRKALQLLDHPLDGLPDQTTEYRELTEQALARLHSFTREYGPLEFSSQCVLYRIELVESSLVIKQEDSGQWQLLAHQEQLTLMEKFFFQHAGKTLAKMREIQQARERQVADFYELGSSSRAWL